MRGTTTALAVAAFALAGGCKDRDDDDRSPKSAGPGASGAPEEPASLPELAPSEPGAAYVLTDRELVTITADGTVSVLDLPVRRTRQLARRADGRLAVAASDRIVEIDEGEIRGRIAAGREVAGERAKGRGTLPSTFERIAFGPDGALWTVGNDAVARRARDGWRVWPLDAVGASYAATKALLADSQGRVWLSDNEGVYRHEDGSWTTETLDHLDPTYPPTAEAFAVDTDGAVYFPDDRSLYVLRDEAWSEREIAASDIEESFNDIAIGPRNSIFLTTPRELVILAPEGGRPHRHRAVDQPRADAVAGPIRVLATDARGRAWVATDAGLYAVAPRQAPAVTALPRGSVPQLARDIRDIAISGGGPTIPAADEVQTGSIRGRLVRGDEPLDRARVQLCVRPRTRFEKGETPCSSALISAETRTDQDGSFVFEQIPLGTYKLAARSPELERWVVSQPCCRRMTPGQELDLGDVDVSRTW